MAKIKNYFTLFISMLKIGLFTFGGGYAMIHILETEFVSKKKMLEHNEFIDLVAIAESTPGPIAINCATYIGYKTHKFFGAVICTIGMVLPSFLIIFVISLFFNQFLSISWVFKAFKGIQICVVFLILSAGLKMLKKIKKSFFNICIIILTLTCMVLFTLFGITFSSIFYIIISGTTGLFIYSVRYLKKSKCENKEVKR